MLSRNRPVSNVVTTNAAIRVANSVSGWATSSGEAVSEAASRPMIGATKLCGVATTIGEELSRVTTTPITNALAKIRFRPSAR
jgi:hypothetical protein